MDSIIERILKILAEQADLPATEIRDEDTLEQLTFDDLDFIQIMMALEEEFAIDIDEADFSKCNTVKQVIDYVAGVCTATEQATIAAAAAAIPFEQRVATLIKANQDALIELDWLKNECSLPEEKLDNIRSIISRGYAACAAVIQPLSEVTA